SRRLPLGRGKVSRLVLTILVDDAQGHAGSRDRDRLRLAHSLPAQFGPAIITNDRADALPLQGRDRTGAILRGIEYHSHFAASPMRFIGNSRNYGELNAWARVGRRHGASEAAECLSPGAVLRWRDATLPWDRETSPPREGHLKMTSIFLC